MSMPPEAAIARAVENLRARNINVVPVRTGAEAKQKVLEMLPEGAEVANGTSTTLVQTGIADALDSGRYQNLMAAVRAENDPVRRQQIRRRTVAAEYFLGSVNAIAETGEVVCADFSGSRIAGYIYPAAHVIWVASANKIVPSLQAALDRLRDVALPQEDQRMKSMGAAGSRISKLLIYDFESVKDRITLVLITAEEYGF